MNSPNHEDVKIVVEKRTLTDLFKSEASCVIFEKREIFALTQEVLLTPQQPIPDIRYFLGIEAMFRQPFHDDKKERVSLELLPEDLLKLGEFLKTVDIAPLQSQVVWREKVSSQSILISLDLKEGLRVGRYGKPGQIATDEFLYITEGSWSSEVACNTGVLRRLANMLSQG